MLIDIRQNSTLSLVLNPTLIEINEYFLKNENIFFIYLFSYFSPKASILLKREIFEPFLPVIKIELEVLTNTQILEL